MDFVLMMYTLNQKMHVSIDTKNNTGSEFYQGYFQTGKMPPEPFSFQALAMLFKERLSGCPQNYDIANTPRLWY